METRTAQRHFGVLCLGVVPDEFASASFIAVQFTPGRQKINYAMEFQVERFTNTELRLRLLSSLGSA